MNTINVSIPSKLKSQAEELVDLGLYASFSDLVRDSLRRVLEKNRYDLWAEEASSAFARGKAIVLKTDRDIGEYFEKL